MEPSWDALRDHLGAMTVKELRGIGRRWFNGTLGGASSKGAIADAMVSQMRHWWRLPDGYGRGRVRNVMKDIDETWRDGHGD